MIKIGKKHVMVGRGGGVDGGEVSCDGGDRARKV